MIGVLGLVLLKNVWADPCGMVPPITETNGNSIARQGAQRTYVFFKDGIGIFVDPISVDSLNLEFEPEVTLDYSALDNIIFFGGISQSLVWTNDNFELGSWKIKEKLNLKETYHNAGIKYEAVKNRFLIEAKIYKNNDSEFFSLRLLVPVQGK